MAYCTISDVQGYYKNLEVGASTAVTTAKLQAMIDGHSATIDARIRKLYETPVDAEEALKVLKPLCCKLVVVDLDPILGQAKADDKHPRAALYAKQAEDLLRSIETGATDLEDATKKGSTIAPATSSARATPVFEKDTRQW
jgi:phage gp36-like protein